LEYVYTALLLHSVGQKINEENVKKVLEASGAKVDEAKVKALVSSLEGINIEEVIKQSAIPTQAIAPVAKEEKKEEKKPTEEEKAESAVEGLASLFG
jgi:large subunit ribosomal protein L12